MARIVPYAAIQFTAHEQWKRILAVDPTGYTCTILFSLSISKYVLYSCRRSPGKQILAGSLAGVTSQSVTYPLDFARARMAVTHKNDYATLRHVSSEK